MSEPNLESLTVVIGEQNFRIRVSPEERDHYLAVADAAAEAYNAVLKHGAFAGPKAMAMALFQTVAELEAVREQLRRTEGPGKECLARLIERIDEVTASAAD